MTKRGRPHGAKSSPDRKLPNPPTALVSARVTPHVFARIEAEAEASAVTPSRLVGEAIAKRWACRCPECIEARRRLRKLLREREPANG